MNLTTRGIDLAKAGFPLHGVDERGQGVLQERVLRQRWRRWLANRPPCRMGLETDGGAHDWARAIPQLGHTVKRTASPFVTPSRQGHPIDRHEAAALSKAVSRPHRRFVAAKTIEQQALQTGHRVREPRVKSRTALAKQRHRVLMAYNIVLAQGLGQGCRALPLLLKDAQNGLTDWVASCCLSGISSFKSLIPRSSTMTRVWSAWHARKRVASAGARLRGCSEICHTCLYGVPVDRLDARCLLINSAWLKTPVTIVVQAEGKR